MRFEGFSRNGKDTDPEQPHDATETEFSVESVGNSVIPEIKSTFDVLSARSANLERESDGDIELDEEEREDLRETLSRFREKLD